MSTLFHFLGVMKSFFDGNSKTFSDFREKVFSKKFLPKNFHENHRRLFWVNCHGRKVCWTRNISYFRENFYFLARNEEEKKVFKFSFIIRKSLNWHFLTCTIVEAGGKLFFCFVISWKKETSRVFFSFGGELLQTGDPSPSVHFWRPFRPRNCEGNYFLWISTVLFVYDNLLEIHEDINKSLWLWVLNLTTASAAKVGQRSCEAKDAKSKAFFVSHEDFRQAFFDDGKSEKIEEE